MAAKPQQDPLARYWSKRNFALTSEPRGDVAGLWRRTGRSWSRSTTRAGCTTTSGSNSTA